jgi:hypothetical protein
VKARAAFVVLIAGLGLSAAAQEAVLAGPSPFGQPAAGTDLAGPRSQELELRGILSTAEGIQYCIYDPARKSGEWVSENDSGAEFRVTSGRPDQDEVTIQEKGRTLTLRLREGKVVSEPDPSPPQAQTGPAIVAHRRPGDPRAPQQKPAQ